MDGQVTTDLLLIDDESDHAALLARALNRHNPAWSIITCSNCAEARAALQTHLPAIVLCDLKLPDGDGLSLLRESGSPHYPTIIMSAHGDEEVAVQIIKAGALDYLVKSEANFRDIGHIVDRCLREWQRIVDLREAEKEQRSLEQQLRQAQKMEAVGQLTGGFAHDFNNMLGGVLGFTELALSQMQAQRYDLVESHLRQVRSAGERARDLIKQLLAFSRGGTYSKENLHLASLIEETMQLLKSSIGKSIAITTRIEPGLPAINHDRIQIQQLLINLVINARDAIGGDSGDIQISLGVQAGDHRRCSSCMHSLAGDYLALTVADSGQGIEEAIRGSIFEPFFTTKEVGRGTGMGLAVVHGTAHEDGGHLLVNGSGQLGGAEFSVMFPLADAAETLFDPGEKRVWIVDDNPASGGYLCELLATEGYRVTLYEEAQQVLSGLQSVDKPPNLVISDLVMPDMRGDELIRKIHSQLPDLPIILTSGYLNALDEQDVGKLDLAGLLSKPVNSVILLERLNDLFSRSVPAVAQAE